MDNRDNHQFDDIPEALIESEVLPRDDPILSMIDSVESTRVDTPDHDEIDDIEYDEEEIPKKPRKSAQKRTYQKRTYKHDRPLGPLTRKTIDRVTSDTIEDIAAHLQSGLRARIARVRPTWCAGWLEDQLIESSEIGPLLEYLASEYGGQSYRITVLGVDGKPMYDGQVQVAGPPKSRGRAIDRDEWEGVKNSSKPAQPAQQHVDNSSIAMVEVLKAMLESERASAKAQISAVREIIESTRSDNASLLKALITQRNTESSQADISTQINNFANVSKALSRLRDTIKPPEEPQREPLEKTNLEKISDVALQAFVSNFVQSKFGNNGQGKTQQHNQSIPIPPIPEALLDGYDPNGSPQNTPV